MTFPAAGDATFTYAAAGSDARVRLTLVSEYAHGAPYGSIVECDGPDTGELVVAAAIVERFPGPGNCGRCPASTLLRYTSAATTVGGETIVLVVGSELAFLAPRQPSFAPMPYSSRW
jgi:hypothetical protein